MVYIPSREELLAEVSARYHEDHPDGPYRLDPRNPDHLIFISFWRGILQAHLQMTTDRVFWDAYPDAPVQLDPNDPEHKQWIDAWIDIRDGIMANAPDLPGVDESGVDMSYARQSLQWDIQRAQARVDTASVAVLDELVEEGLAEMEAAAGSQSIGGGTVWHSTASRSITIDGSEVKFSLMGWWDEDGFLHAAFESDPTTYFDP